jgi:NADH-quinone oxidoreductase subunit J
MACVLLAEMSAIGVWGYVRPALPAEAVTPMSATQNVEQVGWLLFTNYLVPFEVASMLLLAAMVGAIVLARREL